MKRSDVKRIAVMGLGKMGVDWVANLLEGGYEVVGFDALPAARERAPGPHLAGVRESPALVAGIVRLRQPLPAASLPPLLLCAHVVHRGMGCAA